MSAIDQVIYDQAHPTYRPALIYIAGPFASNSPSSRRRRKEELDRYLAHLHYAASLAEQGLCIFSPIVHGYHISTDCVRPPPDRYWLTLADIFLPLATEVHLLRLPGWREAFGVQYETSLAVKHNITIKHIDP